MKYLPIILILSAFWAEHYYGSKNVKTEKLINKSYQKTNEAQTLVLTGGRAIVVYKGEKVFSTEDFDKQRRPKHKTKKGGIGNFIKERSEG